MKCSNCQKESQWLEIIGSDFICHKCISRHKIMGLILRTHTNTFRYIVKKLKLANYQALMNLTRNDIENIVNLRKYGIFLKTSNVIDLK